MKFEDQVTAKLVELKTFIVLEHERCVAAAENIAQGSSGRQSRQSKDSRPQKDSVDGAVVPSQQAASVRNGVPKSSVRSADSLDSNLPEKTSMVAFSSLIEEAEPHQLQAEDPEVSLEEDDFDTKRSSTVLPNDFATFILERKSSMIPSGSGGKRLGRQRSQRSLRVSVKPFVSNPDESTSSTWTTTCFRMRSVWGSSRSNSLLVQSLISNNQELDFDGALSLDDFGRKVRHSFASDLHARQLRCVVEPTAPIRLVWVLLSLLVLSYDFVTVPVEACIDVGSSGFQDVARLITCIFWTMDLLVTFCTGIYVEGVLSMDPWKICQAYLKSWFLFDILLVGSEWAIVVLNAVVDERTVNGGSIVSLFRGARSARIVKLLRVFRIARVLKLRSLLRQVLDLTVEGLQGTLTLMTVFFCTASLMHLGACVWAAVGGADEGWIARSEMKNSPAIHVYAVALQWMLLSLHGSRAPLARMQQTGEILLDNTFLLLSFTVMCCVVAAVTQVALSWATSDTTRLHKLAHRYLKAHDVSRPMKRKTHYFLHTQGLDGPGELISFEAELFKALPPYLQEDLHYESRAPILCSIRGFLTLHSLTPRCVRHVCDRMQDRLVVQGESVFSRGNVCHYMYFVRAGVITYKCEEWQLCQTPRYRRFPRCDDSTEDCDVLWKGQPLSEACLWTAWEHTGQLEAMTHDGLLILLGAEEFSQICSQYRSSRVYGFRYAYHYVGRLNRCTTCDVTGFDMDMDDVAEDTHAGSGADHFIFLSHYKVESGTEAILMRDLLLKGITSDMTHEACDLLSPVFLDTEDLEDLDQLVAHVQSSNCILMLLTPGYLSRPWCLLELVTAVRADIYVVPIAIQRPGLTVEYPDDAWYSSLRKGKVIPKDGLNMLNARGIDLDEIEKVIRTVFNQIAVPFSPHKSSAIRAAEIDDILRRCSGWNARWNSEANAVHRMELADFASIPVSTGLSLAGPPSVASFPDPGPSGFVSWKASL